MYDTLHHGLDRNTTQWIQPYNGLKCHTMDRPARPPACYVARWEEEAALPLAQWGVLSLSRALVGSLYIKINIPTYSRRLPFTEKVVSHRP